MTKKIEQKAAIFIERLKAVVKREALETRIASSILIKSINYHINISKAKPTDKELKFLKEHSIDLLKLLPMIIMFPTPIPYIEIALLLKGLGFNFLLPKQDDLEIPNDKSIS